MFDSGSTSAETSNDVTEVTEKTIKNVENLEKSSLQQTSSEDRSTVEISNNGVDSNLKCSEVGWTRGGWSLETNQDESSCGYSSNQNVDDRLADEEFEIGGKKQPHINELLCILQQQQQQEEENNFQTITANSNGSATINIDGEDGKALTIVASDNDVNNGFVKNGRYLPYVFEANESGLKKKNSKILPLCGVCGKKFVCVTTMKRHLVTHTGEKPFSCKVCGKNYTQKGNLRVHERTHRNDRPFECNICQQKFYRKEPMQKHQWRQHGMVKVGRDLSSSTSVMESPISFEEPNLRIITSNQPAPILLPTVPAYVDNSYANQIREIAFNEIRQSSSRNLGGVTTNPPSLPSTSIIDSSSSHKVECDNIKSIDLEMSEGVRKVTESLNLDEKLNINIPHRKYVNDTNCREESRSRVNDLLTICEEGIHREPTIPERVSSIISSLSLPNAATLFNNEVSISPVPPNISQSNTDSTTTTTTRTTVVNKHSSLLPSFPDVTIHKVTTAAISPSSIFSETGLGRIIHLPPKDFNNRNKKYSNRSQMQSDEEHDSANIEQSSSPPPPSPPSSMKPLDLSMANCNSFSNLLRHSGDDTTSNDSNNSRVYDINEDSSESNVLLDLSMKKRRRSEERDGNNVLLQSATGALKMLGGERDQMQLLKSSLNNHTDLFFEHHENSKLNNSSSCDVGSSSSEASHLEDAFAACAQRVHIRTV